MNDIISLLEKEFNNFFNNKNKSIISFAPGRINLIGEHTDYTGGFVLPAGIDKGTYIISKKNGTKNINIVSLNFDRIIEKIDLTKPLIKESKWTDYIKGCIVYLKEKFKNLDCGFDAIVYGDIPNGAGLSSSASIEMVTILTLLAINDLNVPFPGTKEMVELTLIAQKSENKFVGVNCGIMDQFAIGNSKKNCAIKLDCNTLEFEYCNVKLDSYCLLVSNTNKKRRLEESKYNERRRECEQGFEILKKLGIKKDVLGYVTIEEWEKVKDRVDNPLIKKRLNHVITENNRVKEAFIALNNKDIKKFANLLNESGESLRSDYEVTGEHLDAIVESARETDGVIAARMTGAGFGGCAINIVEKNKIEDIIESIKNNYFKKTGIEPNFYLFNIEDGARIIRNSG